MNRLRKIIFITALGLIVFSLGGADALLASEVKTKNKACRVLDPDIAESYTGECKNGLADGYGVAKGKDRYEGYFKAGRKHGYGVYVWVSDDNHNCDCYKGEYLNGRMHGKGVYIWANGDRYMGEFRNGKKSGKGLAIKANGERQMYLNGNPVKEGEMRRFRAFGESSSCDCFRKND